MRRWDAVNDVELDPLDGHSAQLRTAAFSLDGHILVSLDANGTLIIWDAETWTEIAFILAGPREYYSTLAVSPDGQLAAVGGNQSINVIDVTKQQHIATLAGLPSGVLTLAFSDDGSLLVSSSFDGMVRVWAVPE